VVAQRARHVERPHGVGAHVAQRHLPRLRSRSCVHAGENILIGCAVEAVRRPLSRHRAGSMCRLRGVATSLSAPSEAVKWPFESGDFGLVSPAWRGPAFSAYPRCIHVGCNDCRRA
jgi:hypothetical protein